MGRLIALNPRRNKEQNRAFIMECPLPDYDALTREERLVNLAKRISDTTDDAIPLSSLHEVQRQLSRPRAYRTREFYLADMCGY